jgi:hypothetical protein
MKLAKVLSLASEGFPDGAYEVARIIAQANGYADDGYIGLSHVRFLRAQLRKRTWQPPPTSQDSTQGSQPT